MQRYTGRWLAFLAAVTAAALAWTGCLGGGIDAGQDTRAAYAIAGRVVTASGMPVAGATIQLFPSNYDPASPAGWAIPAVITDSVGFFVFAEQGALFGTKAARAAYYAVTARAPDGFQGSFVDSLRAGTHPASIHTLRLSAPRRLVVSLHADTSFGAALAGTAYLPGTDILVSLAAGASGAVDAVPVQARRLVLRAHAGWTRAVVLPARDSLADPAAADTVRVFGAPHAARLQRQAATD